MEPINGCTLAAANEREILRAHSYLHTTIPARILFLHYSGKVTGHAALVYRLEECWCAYDDGYGTRQLRLPKTADFPPPLAAARAAFPTSNIDYAHWY